MWVPSNAGLLLEGLFEKRLSKEPDAVDEPQPGQHGDTGEEKLAANLEFVRILHSRIGQVHDAL